MKIPDQITNFILEKITDKNRYYVTGGVLLITFLFVILFQVKLLMSLNPKIASLTKNLEEANENIARLGQFQQEVEKFENKIKSINDRVLLKEQIPAALENIAVMAKESNIKINQLVPLRESQDLVLKEQDTQYFSFPVLVHARAGYHDIGRFFNKLENDAVLMNIIDFDITANNESGLQHSMNITIQVFLRESL